VKGEPVHPSQLLFREGVKGDLEATYHLSEKAMLSTMRRQGIDPLDEVDPDEGWKKAKPLVECLAGQPDGSFWIAEQESVLVGYGRSVRLGGVDELSQLMVVPDLHGQGVGRALLERCWPEEQDVPRMVVAAGAPPDLSLYLRRGVLPVAGHWHMRVATDRYQELRSRDVDEGDFGVHVLGRDHALAEWTRLEPQALGHAREALHDQFARTCTCLARMTGDGTRADAVCWVSPEGDIGPAVGARPDDLVPVVLAALDRVANTRDLPELGVFVVHSSDPLVRALARLGFRLHWPSWIMTSGAPPALERYLPTRPPLVL
jgi:GNAT superfamily N-acetyltransferase